MSNNPDSIIELDDRMTEESRNLVQAILKVMKPADSIKVDITLNRKNREANSIKNNAHLKFDDLEITEFTVKNTQDGYDIPVSLYKPKMLEENTPITVFFHGGGWSLNSRITHHHSVASLASSSKSIWLSVDYRLSPEVQFPVNYIDCKSVVEWTLTNRDTISSLGAKVGVSGDSSGGHFAALISHEIPNEIDFQILVYPVVDLEKKEDHTYESHKEFEKDCYLLVPAVMDWFIRNFIGTNTHLLKTPELSPILHEEFIDHPKTLMVCASLDPLRDQSKEYFKKLQANNVPSELHVIEGVHHGFFSQPVLMKNSFNEFKGHVCNFFETL